MTKPATISELEEKAEAVAVAALRVTHDSLAFALVAALADLTVIEPKNNADMGSFKVRYADLASLVKLTRRHLANHGLVVLTPLCHLNDSPAVQVTIVHEGGESLTFGPFPFQHGRDAQATGSWVTYMRRYALVAALGMAAGDDDDGAAAQPRQPEVVWNAGMVKARLVELLGTKEAAKDAWVGGHGDDLTAWSPAEADRLAALWRENQPAEPALPLGDES